MSLLCGCSSVVPDDAAFAAGRCQTFFDDNVKGAPTIEIGAIFQLTKPDGTPDFDGNFDAQAMRLAIKELNDNRDIAGNRFTLRICDTHADWSTGGGQWTRDLTHWLIDHEHVQAIISDASADTAQIQAITVPRGVLLMAISATAEDLTNLQDKGLVWRVAPSDIYQGAVLAYLIAASVGADEKVAVLAMKSPYADGLVDALGKQLKKLSIHTFDIDGKGLDAAVKSAAADGAKALVVVATIPLTAQVANLANAEPALKSIKLFVADGACDSSLASQTFASGVSLAGGQCTRPGQPATPIYTQFRGRFQSEYEGKDPALSSYSQHAYDTVYSVALAHAWALRAGGPGKIDGLSLAEGLRHLSKGDAHPYKPSEINVMEATLGKGQDINVEGTSGPLDFNPDTGEAPSGYEGWVLGEHGELKTKTYYSVADNGGGNYTILPVDVTPP